MKENKFLKTLLSSLMALSVISTSAAPVLAEDTEAEPKEEILEVTPDETAEVAKTEAVEEQTVVSYSAETDGILVKAEAEEGTFPVGVEMKAAKVNADDYADLAKQAIGTEDDYFKAVAVDISFVDEFDNEYEPAEGKTVSVRIATDEIRASDTVSVVHIAGEGQEEAKVLESVVEDDAMSFETDGFSVFVVVDSGDSEDDTDNEKAVASYQFKFNGEVVDTQYVKAGDTLFQPETPDAGKNMRFLGWFLESNTDTEVTFGTVSTVTANEVINCVAKFEKTYFVTYYDGKEDDGKQNILQINTVTVVVVEGTEQPGSEDITKVSATERASDVKFRGWSYTDGGEIITTSPIAVTKDVELFPVYAKGAWIHFVSGPTGSGATYYAPKLINYNETTSNPGTPTRTGYIFAGWYTEEEGGTEFSFGGTISEDTTVYAHWTAGQTKYTIVYWKQKVTDDKNATTKTYDFAGTESGTATSNSTVTLTNAQKNAKLPSAGFDLNNTKTESSKEIAADGTTTINVYYDRWLMTVNFRTSGNSFLYSYSGLYEQTLAQNNYTWDSEYDWYLSRSTYNNIQLTFLDAFIFTNLANVSSDGKTLTCYRYNSSGSRYIYHYKQNVNGTWPSIDDYAIRVSAGTGGYNVTNKFTGFEVKYYIIGSNNWDRTWNNTSTGSSINGSSSNMYLRYERNKNSLQFIDSYDNTVYGSYQVYYEAPLNSYANAVSEPTSSRPGYRFSGWYSDSECSTKFDFASTMPNSDVAVYAGWEPIYYLIQVDPDGGVLTHSESTFFWLKYGAYIQEYTDVVRNYVKNGEGASFYYINEQHDDFYIGKKGLSADYIWDHYQELDRNAFYTETPTAGNHIAISDYDGLYAYEEGAYKIIGWYEIGEGGSETPYEFGTEITKDIKIRAKWRRVGNFYVNYYDTLANDYAVSPVDNNSYSDKSNVVVLGKPAVNDEAHKGYRFVGWKYNGSIYYPNDVIELKADLATDTKTIDGKDYKAIKLEAVWNKLPTEDPEHPGTVVVTFHGNAGTEATVTVAEPTDSDKFEIVTEGVDDYNKKIRVPINVAFDLSKITAQRPGYAFMGWANKADATTSDVLFVGSEIVGADEKEWLPNDLYAVWSKSFQIDHSSADIGGLVDTYTVDGYEVESDGSKGAVAKIVKVDETTKLPVLDANGIASFDLTKAVVADHFYGGYYSARPEAAYVGGRNLWSQSNAYQDNGMELHPTQDIYYLKEVPDWYLQPFTQYVRNKSYENVVCGLYMVTAVDDGNYDAIGLFEYKDVGSDAAPASLAYSRFTMSYKLEGNGALVEFSAPTVTSNKASADSPVAVWNITESALFGGFAKPAKRPELKALFAGRYLRFAPYVLTPDKVNVNLGYREFTTVEGGGTRTGFSYMSTFTDPANRRTVRHEKAQYNYQGN